MFSFSVTLTGYLFKLSNRLYVILAEFWCCFKRCYVMLCYVMLC